MNDLISRQAAIDAIYALSNYTIAWLESAVDEIEALPSAQPEQQEGQWIDAVIPNDNGGLPVQVCDQCNTFFPLAYTGGGHSFCPHCGARMVQKGGKNE